MSHRLPPLNGLRAFEASARHLSFKTAARELGVTSGAVSQQVKALEATLQVELFRRLPRGLLLTDIGQAYLPDLSEAFRIISKSTEAIAPALTGRKLKIGIGKDLRSHLPENWPVPSDALYAHVGKPVVTTDLELVRSGDLDGLLQLHQVTAHGLSNEKIASIQTPTVTEAIYYICPVGLAGCRQSRVLVSSLISTFSETGKC